MRTQLTLVVALVGTTALAAAQPTPEPGLDPTPERGTPAEPVAAAEPAAVPTVPQVRFDLGEGAFIRLITWHQVWVRAMETNPGTTVGGNPEDWAFDVGLRRSRFLALAEFDRAQILFHFGINNQSFVGERKPQLFVHDVWASYALVERHLTLGAGLHFWNGISRLASASTITTMALDSPILNWPLIDRSDQFGRQLGLFAKGRVGPLDYRVALNRPFAVSQELVAGGATDYRPDAERVAFAGYLQWFFLEEESNALPYAVGTYLGTKRVLNLGAGWHWHPGAMGRLDTDGTEHVHDILALGVDVFADHPLGAGFAITGYAGFYHYDFGPDYVRNVGIMNIGAGGTTFAGPGNAYPMMGTGEHLYTQLGLLIPASRYFAIQPYLTLQVSQMDALADPSVVVEGGINWMRAGHHAKLTTHYRSRPIFASEAQGVNAVGRSSELILQLQLFI